LTVEQLLQQLLDPLKAVKQGASLLQVRMAMQANINADCKKLILRIAESLQRADRTFVKFVEQFTSSPTQVYMAQLISGFNALGIARLMQVTDSTCRLGDQAGRPDLLPLDLQHQAEL